MTPSFRNGFKSHFRHEGTDYNCAQSRALRRQNVVSADDGDLAQQKTMSCLVSTRVWDISLLGIAHQAVQVRPNPNLRSFLFGTDNKILAEASPYGAIWGIGLAAEDPRAYQPSLWQGLNLLGRVLISIRQELSSPLPPPASLPAPPCQHPSYHPPEPPTPTPVSRRSLIAPRSNRRVVCWPCERDTRPRSTQPRPAHCPLRLLSRNMGPTSQAVS